MKWPDGAQARQLKRFQLMQGQAQQNRLIVDDLETKERPKDHNWSCSRSDGDGKWKVYRSRGEGKKGARKLRGGTEANEQNKGQS
jgi:hypothetical protein